MWINEDMFFKGGNQEESQEQKLKDLYYNPSTGFCGYKELQRKSSVPEKICKEFSEKQDVCTKFKPVKDKFTKRTVVVNGIDDQWQADLLEVIKYSYRNSGFKYILTCIDIFSKFAWAIPLKNKTSSEILRAFKIIFEKRTPKKIQTDAGKEFYNTNVKKLFQSLNIEHFSSYSNLKASVVERFNRTIRERLENIFEYRKSKVWIDILDDVLNNYNNSFHRSIKMSPIDASKKENEEKVKDNLYILKEIIRKPKFMVGDKIRIRKYKFTFDKGYKQNYSTKIHTIKKVFQDIKGLPYYNLEDILGSFYEEEMVKVL